jgi:hypothetical protein
VGIEPERGSARRSQAAVRTDGGVAVSAEHEGKLAGVVSRPDRDGETSGQLEGGSNLD